MSATISQPLRVRSHDSVAVGESTCQARQTSSFRCLGGFPACIRRFTSIFWAPNSHQLERVSHSAIAEEIFGQKGDHIRSYMLCLLLISPAGTIQKQNMSTVSTPKRRLEQVAGHVAQPPILDQGTFKGMPTVARRAPDSVGQ